MGNCLESAASSNVVSTTISTNTKPSSTTGTSIGTSNGVGISGTTTSSRSDDEGEVLPAADLKVYAYSDLKSCTKNFKSDMVLGIGGFGTVYKGWVEEKTMLPSKNGTGSMVAIKKLNHESVQGFQEWQSEVNFLGRLSHPNLVKLIGYCREDKDLLLVYEFMQKGSLENHLFRRGSAVQPLSWALRLKIAIGAARGLAFLHSSDDNVIYRDIKASNILLDGNYNAKISDFGMAKLGPSGGMSHVTTRIMGTYGYAAPEYIATVKVLTARMYAVGVPSPVPETFRKRETARNAPETVPEKKEAFHVDCKHLGNVSRPFKRVSRPGVDVYIISGPNMKIGGIRFED